MSWLAKYSSTVSLSVLVVLLAGYSIFEAAIISGSSQPEQNLQNEIARSLNQGVNFFENLSGEFQTTSNQIFNNVNDAIQTRTERMALHNRLEEYDIWGVTVFHDNSRWFWTGFDVSSPSDSTIFNSRGDTTTIVNFNNVIAFLDRRTINFNEEEYTVVTADKLSMRYRNFHFLKTNPFNFQVNQIYQTGTLSTSISLAIHPRALHTEYCVPVTATLLEQFTLIQTRLLIFKIQIKLPRRRSG